MTHKEIEDYILSFPDTWFDFSFGEKTAVYKTGDKKTGDGKMFALIAEGSKPLRISLKCDPLLAEKLREDYETVLPGYNLNKKHWNTIICTGQVPDDELKSLISISYNLVKTN
jgi:predicted DNA-binding protein (MmcQ/YjbR family)